MYRPGNAGTKPDGLAGAISGDMGLRLEGRWLSWRYARTANRLVAQSATQGQQGEWISVLHMDRFTAMELAVSKWRQLHPGTLEKSTVTAAVAVVNGCIGDLAVPDDGTAILLAAAALSLMGERVRIVVTEDAVKERLESPLADFWLLLPACPQPELMSLVRLADEPWSGTRVKRKPLYLLHDAGGVLAETGERLAVSRGNSEIGAAEFVRRALGFAEDVQEGDYHFDMEKEELLLHESFLAKLEEGADRSFGPWRNTHFREAAAAAGILAVHCLREDEDVKFENDRIVPLHPRAAALIAASGIRTEAVLAAHHGLDPQPFFDQVVRRLRETLPVEEVYGGISFSDAAISPFFWRAAGLLTTKCFTNRLSLMPQRPIAVQPGANEEVLDFRSTDSLIGDLDVFRKLTPPVDTFRVIGIPKDLKILRFLDECSKKNHVCWELSSQDVCGKGLVGDFLERLPGAIRWPILRLLCVAQLHSQERRRCRRLENGLISQERISGLLAITSTGRT
ncbi:MAG: hypothetical protein V7746_16840 [Halioglobus sp.]